MFVLLAAVPALLVVVLGYVTGHAVARWTCDLLGVGATSTPEVAGWTTGLALLAVVVWLLLLRWRRRGVPPGSDRREGHQK